MAGSSYGLTGMSGQHLAICIEGQGTKRNQQSVQLVSPAELRTQYFLNARVERYRYVNPSDMALCQRS
jgi:hypothetical protein